MSDNQTYKDFKDEVKAEQGSMTREEVAEMMKKRSEYLLDLDNMKPTQHRWIDRGQVMSCEGGDHPAHRAFKRR